MGKDKHAEGDRGSDQMITPATTLRRTKEILASHLGDETVMMDLDRGSYYGLNVTALHIWRILAQPTIVGELCEQLVGEFAVPRDQCEQEVLIFLGDLLYRGLVKAES
jgi:hypothetical protein